ncbi:type IV conjugative transfer system protein TraE [Betaproteobacteria bacterium SCN1]|jgi:conjugal transfer pilus assembly protein TraE|nr:type IV conjugative transfer system protein TraE [Betaproteobacteria bacterium SCN1]MBN8759847.1 type IV conjugative transfer system protein TraE [Thiobacillus sp.]ODU89472.1 MAG: type IV conjugative transfer system protein TraE [Thiobacillus sp. SCN 65-179]OJW37401.1 MAG: type IV conjugative transfer system protein TraE [Thiobacillus sp. 65-69]
MRIDKLSGHVAAATGVKQWMVAMFALSQLALVLTLIIFLARGDTHRETLVPPTIHSTFWVQDDKVSKEYLIEMGVFLAQLYFDVTPQNVEFNHRTLKNYVDPRFYGVLETQAGAYAQKVKSDNASTFLAIATVIPDEANQRIGIQGVLNTYLGDTRTSQANKTYVFEFGRHGGRVLLIGMKEGKNATKPFEEITTP